MIEFYRRIYSNYFRSQKGSCLNKYHTVKKNIEKQINDFYKISGRNVYKEWDQLYKYIIDTDKDLKVCYDNKYVNVKLIEDDTIKKFTEKCKRNRTCYNVAPPAIKPPIIKPTTQKHCKDRDSCKKGTAATDDGKSQSKLVPRPTDSKSLEIKNLKEQGQNQANLQKLRQESVVSQSYSITMPSVSSVGMNDKTSEEVGDHHSTTSGMVETQKQQLDASVHSGNSELGSPLTDNSSQCISGATSDLTITTTGKNLVEKGIQTNEHSRNPLDAKHSTSQDSLSKIVAGVSGDDKGVTKDAAHNLSLTESTPGSVQRADEDSLSTTTDRESTGAVASDPESTGTEEVVSASLSSAPSNAGNNGITVVDMSANYIVPDSEIKSVKFSHVHTHDSERLCTEGTCNEAQNTEITSDSNNVMLGTLSRVFNVIQENKDNMIKASAPMGIVMLLGLIFKYTPLWRVLTKKNRKKGAVIIEELNSVVQEPSIMDDERSIPFSYGAFEYSSFDQNVY